MTEEVIINVQTNATEALARQQELKASLISVKEKQEKLKESGDILSETYIKNEAQIKLLNQQLNANGNVLKGVADTTNAAGGAYAALNNQAAIAAQRAKDMSVAYGSNDARTKEAVASAKALSDQLKEVDKSVGQNQRSVGDYEIAVKKLPGVFGDLQSSATNSYNSIKTKIEEVKAVMTTYITAINAEKAAKAEAIVAAELAAKAEAELALSEEAGTATAAQVAAAETARASATAAATVATDAGSASMKIFKVALASTGIGLLVVALGALVAYFTSTNDGAKVFQKIMSGVNAVLQTGVKIMGSLGRLIYDVLTGNVDKLGSDLKTVVDNVKGATTEIGNTYKAGEKAAQNRQMMNKKEREWMVERTKLEGDYAVLVQNAGKRSRLDDEGKLKAAKEALRIKELIYQNDLKIAANNLKVINQEQALNSKKDYQAIADAQNKVQQIIATHKQQQNSVDNLMGKTEQRIDAADKASVKSANAAAKKRIEATQRENDENTKTEKELQAFKLKTLKENAEADISAVQEEMKLIKLKNEERLAGQKLSDDEIYAQKTLSANQAWDEEQRILEAKLSNQQITQEEFNKQSILNQQQLNTDKFFKMMGL